MRKIKYRIWDKRIKEMGEVTELRFSKVQHHLVKYRYIDKSGKMIDEQSHFDEGFRNGLDIMQYTGFKDEGGKEIYEGDIVKCTDGEGGISELNSDTGIGQVEWLEKFGFWNISNIENGLGDIILVGFVEVIGNIYENPELL